MILDSSDGFEWDDGNSNKNWHGHRVTDTECEEVFYNLPIRVGLDTKRKSDEPRYSILGQTNSGKLLYVAFSIRSRFIRVISAREMNVREVRRYEEEVKRNPRF